MSSHVRRWHLATTLAVLVLSVTSSLLGLLQPGFYTDPAELLARTRAEDLVILAIAVPVLAVGLWYARRGSTRGRIVWLGALAFTTYVWASRLVSLSFNAFFLEYVALVTLSLFTLVGGLLDTDADAVRRRLDGRLRERRYASVLAVIATGLAALWLSDVVPASLAGTPPTIVAEFGPRGLGTVAIDLGLVVPALAVSAAWLWRGRAWGYVAAGVLLVFGSLLAPALTAITAFDVLRGVSMTPGLVAGTIVPPLVAVAAAVGYLRAVASNPATTGP